jgi:hypothetical protein
MSMTLVLVLLLAFQLKHFLADFPLQRRFMLGKFKDGWDFVPPLLAHVAVHAVGTFLITCYFGVKQALLLALFDASVHFVMDRVKASKKLLGRFKPLTAATAPTASKDEWKQNDYFWWALGLDQGVHHLTHYAVIFYVVFHAAR